MLDPLTMSLVQAGMSLYTDRKQKIAAARELVARGHATQEKAMEMAGANLKEIQQRQKDMNDFLANHPDNPANRLHSDGPQPGPYKP